MNSRTATQQGPDYDVEIQASDLLEDIAGRCAQHARQHAYHRRTIQDDPTWKEPQIWEAEEHSAMNAYWNALIKLQPTGAASAGRFLNDDGTVDVRGYMLWLSDRADAAHQDAGTFTTSQMMARKAEHAYSKTLSIIREDHGVGWPRLDELGGNPLEEDLP